ncbi:MAG: Ldh family oxidoreductase, partial [Flavisolibacter sp.]|nr:Ldh family oxidoreductase [Flavisolibacter sp.]
KRNIDEWIYTMRNTKPQPGKEKVLIPGDPEREAYQLRMKEGIPVHKEVVAFLEDIAGYTGVKLNRT